MQWYYCLIIVWVICFILDIILRIINYGSPENITLNDVILAVGVFILAPFCFIKQVNDWFYIYGDDIIIWQSKSKKK